MLVEFSFSRARLLPRLYSRVEGGFVEVAPQGHFPLSIPLENVEYLLSVGSQPFIYNGQKKIPKKSTDL